MISVYKVRFLPWIFDLVNQWKINHSLPYLLAMILKANNNT